MSAILPHITFDTGPAPLHSIIWLHGLGADGHDFLPIADELNLPVAVRYIFPHAPEQPVTINGGYIMRSWYDIVATDIGSKQDAAGIRAAQAEIEKIIAQERTRGVAAKNIFLAGFSQGGAVVLHTGLRHSEPLGGILALSTYLPLAETFLDEVSAPAKSTPIFMAHGHDDAIVPYALGKLSVEKLTQQGCQVTWCEYDMQHSVCPAEIRDIQIWLTQQLL
jgi:phospholipase/carboxylesterase